MAKFLDDNGLAYLWSKIKAAITKTVNPNLLDNWYFANPVNQRNVSGTITTAGYFIDRWKLTSGSVTVNSGSITLNGTIVQIRENGIGGSAKATILTSAGVQDVSYDDSTRTFTVTGSGVTIIAAKLELGDTQTLAHQDASGNWVLNEIPNYGEQLARGQRYQVGIGFTSAAYLCHAYSTTGAYVFIPTPTTLRARPTFESLGGAQMTILSGWYFTTNIPVTSVVVDKVTSNGVTIFATVDGGLTAGNKYMAGTLNDGTIILNANL